MKPSSVFATDLTLAQRRHLRRAKHALATAELRVRVLTRSAVTGRGRPTCELCCSCGRGLELHHAEGGSGRRRQQQCDANALMACEDCHRLAHRNDPLYFARLARFVERHGYPEPACLRRRATAS